MENVVKVLIIDDDEMYSRMLANFLDRNGYSAKYVGSGEKASELLEKEGVDVVITDPYLNKRGGFEIVEYVKNQDPQTNVIVITGSRLRGDRMRAIECGADSFFTKPFSSMQLLEQLPSA